MNRWLIFILWTTSFGAAAQTESPDNSVFISQEIDDVDYESFSLNTSYYTIANNIDNRQSSAFISDAPTDEERLYFAQHQPSYSFLVHHQRTVVRMIVFQQKTRGRSSSFSYTIVNPASGHRQKVPSQLSGQLTQLRAQELTQHTAAADSWRDDTRCLLNGTPYTVLPLAEVQREVATLVQHHLGQEQGRMDELKEYIRAETIGGTLDFSVALARESQQRFSRGGVVYTKARFSVLLWGGAVRMLGLGSVERARLLWEEIQQRTLTPPEWQALRTGFRESSF